MLKKKNSMKRYSFKRTITGLAFMPTVKPKLFYGSVHEWLEAGKLDNATIFDHVDTLNCCGIQVCDAIVTKGLYIRLPVPLKPVETKIIIVPLLIRPLASPVVKTKIEGVQVSDKKEHHRMSY